MPRHRFLPVAVLLSASLITAALGSDLTWSHTRIEAVATPEQDQVETLFHFKNAGRQPVTIQDVHTSCGCTTATLEKKTYAPGEEGDIKAVFTTAGHSGTEEKTIFVQSSDAPDHPSALTLAVTVNESFRFEPKLLIWPAASDGSWVEKKTEFSTFGGAVLKIVHLRSDNPDFETRLDTLEADHRYVVAVKPRATAKPGRLVLRVEVESPAGKFRTVAVYGLIKSPAPSP